MKKSGKRTNGAMKPPKQLRDSITSKVMEEKNSGRDPKPETAIGIRPLDGSPRNSRAIEKSELGPPVEATWDPKAAKQELHTLMKGSFGTEHPNAQDRLFKQMNGTRPDSEIPDYKSMDSLVGILHGIGPRDQVEGLLAMQMSAAHTLAMAFVNRAVWNKQTDSGIELYVNRAMKCMRTFAGLTEALSRYRSRGEQKMTVEHVHIHKGGQAIVGQVTQKNIQVKRKNSNGLDEQG